MYIDALPGVGIAAVVAILALFTTWRVDGAWNWGPAAWLLVPLALYCLHLFVAPPDPLEETEPPPGLYESGLSWAGAAAGAVVVIIGVGVLRAAILPVLVDDIGGELDWFVLGLSGAVAAVWGGRYVQQLVVAHQALFASTITLLGTLFVAFACWAWLLFLPLQAHLVGTAGVIAVGFASFSLLAGILTWTARTRARWSVTGDLGWVRTPWLGLVVAVWLLAGQLDARGAYHDVRLVDEQATIKHSDIAAAFVEWSGAQCESQDAGPRPLLLIAAPGGGIRAAYWTATALDELAGPVASCSGRSVFALSGVSGGSLGVATWVRARGNTSISATESVELSADDHALAAGAAGLLTRDVIQPLFGMASMWDDRAAQFEDSWQRHGTVFHDGANGARWSSDDEPGSWEPVVVLNAASVNDGCRVLVTNTGRLPSNPQVRGAHSFHPAAGEGSTSSNLPDCQAAPSSGDREINGFEGAERGPVSAALDMTWTSAEGGGQCRIRDLRATTAALLSARFPYVTPAGALRSCDDPERVTYVVDGGYYENSGMLTLLQVRAALAEKVAEYNDGRSPSEQVELWVVVLDNHYRTDRSAPPPSRPRQLFAPLRATSAADNTFSQRAMEQQAAAATACPDDSDVEPACPPKFKARFVRIAPKRSPAVAAPLGWVLSASSRNDLDEQLRIQMNDQAVQLLRTRLSALEGD